MSAGLSLVEAQGKPLQSVTSQVDLQHGPAAARHAKIAKPAPDACDLRHAGDLHGDTTQTLMWRDTSDLVCF